jgi:hypothetical protein
MNRISGTTAAGTPTTQEGPDGVGASSLGHQLAHGLRQPRIMSGVRPVHDEGRLVHRQPVDRRPLAGRLEGERRTGRRPEQMGRGARRLDHGDEVLDRTATAYGAVPGPLEPRPRRS